MKKILIPILMCSAFVSCKPDKKALLEKTWRAVTLVNPQMDTVLMRGQMFIDTIGKHTDAQANIAMYGTNNMDSLKQGLQLQLDSVKIMQLNTVQQTVFTFRKDGIAVLSFNGTADSSKWYFDDDKTGIILDEMKEKGAGDKIKMEILDLSDTSLKLNFQENGVNSQVTFHPDKK